MKKLLFIALFSIGLFSVSNAQFVVYDITNSNPGPSLTWDVGMATNGSATYELNILPGQQRVGVIPSFTFPFEFKCQNSNGCGAYQFVPVVTNGVYVPITSCGVPTGLKYRFEVGIPFVTWDFEMKLG